MGITFVRVPGFEHNDSSEPFIVECRLGWNHGEPSVTKLDLDYTKHYTQHSRTFPHVRAVPLSSTLKQRKKCYPSSSLRRRRRLCVVLSLSSTNDEQASERERTFQKLFPRATASSQNTIAPSAVSPPIVLGRF